MFKITELNRKWWILFAMTSTISIIFIDITVLPVALPTIQRQLNLSDLDLQWIVNAYTLALSVFVLVGGKLGDIFGHRKIFCYGLLLFSAASVLCGLSLSGIWFILSRILQGMGGALLIPSTLAIIINAFPLSQRGKALGIYVSVGSVFLAIAPFIGGLFSEYLTWRLVFWINIPIALTGFILAMISVPKSEGKNQTFDFFGFVTMSLGIALIVIGIMQSKNWGWGSPLTIFLICAGVVLIALLILFDKKIEHPFIDFKIFKSKNFSGSILSIFCTQFLVMITVFWAVYFQTVLDYTPLQAGLLSSISSAPVVLIAPLGGHLLDRYGPKIPITIGYLCLICSLLWFLHVLHYKNMVLILTAILPFGCAFPLIFTPSFTAAMSEVSDQKRGIAAATSTMIRQFGSTLGLALFGAFFLHIQNNKFADCLREYTETSNVDISQFEGILSGSPSSLEALSRFSHDIQFYIQKCYQSTYVDAFSRINLIAVFFGCIGFIFALSMIKKKLHNHNGK